MDLKKAHEGYAYQDLLSAYFILNEITNERVSTIHIDRKEYDEDIVDDLTIEYATGILKRQIKYSNINQTHRLEKKDLSQDGNYNLALDKIFQVWNKHPQKEILKLSVCLSWLPPIDDLNDVLREIAPSNQLVQKTFQIDIDKLWPVSELPIKTWRRFRTIAQGINKRDFGKFCEIFSIELGYPKFNINTHNPGELERAILDQISNLGIGVYPNETTTIEEFSLSLVELVKRIRSTKGIISIQKVMTELGVRTDYGSIEQNFPVIKEENISLKGAISDFIEIVHKMGKVSLSGEPGSGKSWFIENLKKELEKRKIKVVRHFCYTDLEDPLQKERITLNALFGNLIAEILKEFPHLKERKALKYASNLSELNLLLTNIEEPIFLIVDGLDHIERVFSLRSYEDISAADVAVIENLSKIQCSQYVKLLIASQPIPSLNSITGLYNYTIPTWTVSEIKSYVKKRGLKNKRISNSTWLIDVMFQKSEGNPLYLKYMTEELKQDPNLDIYELPPYSSNLEGYYKYLLSKIDPLQMSVPRVLSGVSFSISKLELKEITGEGDYVEEAISILKPLLKLNVAKSGYALYHESFRRFLVNTLKEKKVSIEKVIFNPIIEWFKAKGFFEFQKSFRFYLQFLSESGRPEEITKYLNHKFVTDSIIHGHSWGAIRKNYNYFKLSALSLSDYPGIITLNQLAKTISSTEDALEWVYTPYLNALGHLKGFGFVSDYLSFDGKSTVSLKSGLQGCYLCDKNNQPSPWEFYMDYFEKGRHIELEDFRVYLRAHISQGNKAEIGRIARKLLNKKELYKYSIIFTSEINSNIEFRDRLITDNQSFKPLLSLPKGNHGNISCLAESIIDLSYEHIHDEGAVLVNEFLNQLKHCNDYELLSKISKKFEVRNWFYNWLIYCIKIQLFRITSDSTQYSLIGAFEFLIYDLEPFKGRPKASGLYLIRDTIFESVVDGLLLLNSLEEWEKVINILLKLTNGTTVELKKELAGPLSSHDFFRLLDECANEINVHLIIDAFKSEIEINQTHQLHWYVADYHFRISRVYSLVKNKIEAENFFKRGVEFVLGYTHRNDSSLEDPLQAVLSLSKLDKQLGLESIRKLKRIVDSVVEHTEKGTRHFPIDWFDNYAKIDFKESSIYLLNELKQTRYSWVLESSLECLLNEAKGKINPKLELWLNRSLPIENSEKHLSTIVELCENLKQSELEFARTNISSLYVKAKLDRNNGYSLELLSRIYRISKELGLNESIDLNRIKRKENYVGKWDPIFNLKHDSMPRSCFSEMSLSNMKSFLKEKKLTNKELNSLIYYFDNTAFTDEEILELAEILIEENSRYYSEDSKIDIDLLFSNSQHTETLFQVSKFIHQHGNWYQELINIPAFQRAFSLDKQTTFKYLNFLLESKLKVNYSRTLSANLFNAFVEIEYDRDTVLKMWDNLFQAIDFRLPYKEIVDWSLALENDLEMNEGEILACLLFCRFKSYTSERYLIALAGFTDLLYSNPDLMIKPLKWFVRNYKYFLESILLSILEVLREYNNEDIEYIQNFRTELGIIHPTQHYLIDVLIETLANIEVPLTQLQHSDFYLPIKEEEYQILLGQSTRHKMLEKAGLDIRGVLAKVSYNHEREYRNDLNLYWNTSNDKMAKNILRADFLLTKINRELYADFRDFQNDQRILDDITIDIRSLVAQQLSWKLRPDDLIKPSKTEDSFRLIDIGHHQPEWIRIGHYEIEYLAVQHHRFKLFQSAGGIVYSKRQPEILPFNNFLLQLPFIWDNRFSVHAISECPVSVKIQQYDSLEDYMGIWLNPAISKTLGIRICNFSKGFIGMNLMGDAVLKCEFWKEDYVGDGHLVGVADEIPKLQGMQLLIRYDYLSKLNSLYKIKPSYSFQKL